MTARMPSRIKEVEVDLNMKGIPFACLKRTPSGKSEALVMSRRRDGRRCWPTSAAYGAIAAGWGAPGRPASPWSTVELVALHRLLRSQIGREPGSARPSAACPVPRPGEPRAFGVIEDLLALFSGRGLSGAGDDRRRSLS
jgi:hypothetical protein